MGFRDSCIEGKLAGTLAFNATPALSLPSRAAGQGGGTPPARFPCQGGGSLRELTQGFTARRSRSTCGMSLAFGV